MTVHQRLPAASPVSFDKLCNHPYLEGYAYAGVRGLTGLETLLKWHLQNHGI
jgi:hypothetical protein